METKELYKVESINHEEGTATILCDHCDGYMTRYNVNCLTTEELAELESLTSNDLKNFIRTCGCATAERGLLPEPQTVKAIQNGLNCEISEETYNYLTSKYDGAISRILQDIENDYLTANKGRDGELYVNYFDGNDNRTFIINATTGKERDIEDWDELFG